MNIFPSKTKRMVTSYNPIRLGVHCMRFRPKIIRQNAHVNVRMIRIIYVERTTYTASKTIYQNMYIYDCTNRIRSNHKSMLRYKLVVNAARIQYQIMNFNY